MKPLREFCYINTECSEHGKRGGKNLRVHQTYGKSDTIRLLECKMCGRKFSERVHTALSGSRLPKEKIISILHHLAEGCGQRRICRLVGVSRDAVSRLARIAGDHAKALHDELVNSVQVKEAQADDYRVIMNVHKYHYMILNCDVVISHDLSPFPRPHHFLIDLISPAQVFREASHSFPRVPSLSNRESFS